MAVLTKAQIVDKFVNSDVPSQADYQDLIDTLLSTFEIAEVEDDDDRTPRNTIGSIRIVRPDDGDSFLEVIDSNGKVVTS